MDLRGTSLFSSGGLGVLGVLIGLGGCFTRTWRTFLLSSSSKGTLDGCRKEGNEL